MRLRSVCEGACALLALSAILERNVRAEPSGSPRVENSPPVETRLSYWDHGDPRLFVAARVEAGLYVKPQISVGYGKPYWINTSAEAYGISTTSFGAGYAGIRGTLPFLDLRIGARYTYSYYRSFLLPKQSYVAEDVSQPAGPLARYPSLETELAGVVPALAGYFFPVVTIYRIVDTPADRYLFDESLRGVLKPPWIIGLRLGYVKSFGHDEFIKVGALSELVLLPGRSDSIVRLGPAAQVSLTNHLEAIGTITFVLASPDSLGIWNGPFGVLGLVYRWATGDRNPAFP